MTLTDTEVENDEIQKQITIEEDSADESDSFEGLYPNDIVRDNASREVDNHTVPAHSEPEQLEEELVLEAIEDSRTL